MEEDDTAMHFFCGHQHWSRTWRVLAGSLSVLHPDWLWRLAMLPGEGQTKQGGKVIPKLLGHLFPT